MKTITQIKKEITDIKYRIENEEMKKAQQNRLRKQIPVLKQLIVYLEGEPTESFIKSEIEKVKAKIDRRMGLFVLDGLNPPAKSIADKLRKEHKKKYDVPILEAQLKTLQYLLK